VTEVRPAPPADDGEHEHDLLVRVVVLGVAVLALVSAVEVLPWTIDDVVAVGGGTGGTVDVGTTVRLVTLSFFGMACAGALAGVLLVRLRVLHWRRSQQELFVAGTGLAIGLARTGAVALGLGGTLPSEYVILETALGAGEAAAVIAASIYYVGTRRRIRTQERLRVEAALRAEQASRELEQEELRVRREVSHRLHGGLQQRMVLVNREIEEIRDVLARHGEVGQAKALTELSATLDEIRESEVRAVAHELYPLAAEIDLPSALLLVMDRLPASVSMQVEYEGDAEPLYTGSALTPGERVLLYSIVEEGATNAIRHGDARHLWVTLGAGPARSGDGDDPGGRTVARVRVDDDGSGLPADREPALSGLAVLQARVRAHGGELTIAAGPRGGARLAARLPLVARAAEGRGRP